MRTRILLAAVFAAVIDGCASPSRLTDGPPLPATVAQVSISPDSLSLEVGQTLQLSATAQDAGGSLLLDRVATWNSTDTAVAQVSSAGLLDARQEGQALIRVTIGEIGAMAPLLVRRVPVASVSITPASPRVAVGGTVQLTATTRDARGATLTGRAVSWRSSNARASVSATGLATGLATGTATITATSEGVSGKTVLTVTTAPPAPVATVAVTVNPSTITVSQTAQASAVLKDASGSVLTGRVIAWATSDASVATVNSTGVVTALAVGSARISATSEGVSGDATLTAAPAPPPPAPVSTVDVTLSASSLIVGQTAQANAVTKDSSGNVLTGRAITWSTSNPSAVTVTATGSVNALAAGSANVLATSEGKLGSAAVTVAVAPVASVAVSLGSTDLAVAQTTQATALLKDVNGNVLTGRSVSWASSNTSVATVSASGLVTAIDLGNADVIATSDAVSGQKTLVVSLTGSVTTGLLFPGNVSYPSASPSIVFVFNAAISGTAPFPAYPATYIWRVYPQTNVNYWSGLFHANYTSTFTGTQQYYGMHPYPHYGAPTAPPHWEISMGGGDLESDSPVVLNQWYTQVVTTTNGFVQTYYWNWPNNTTDVLTAQDVAKAAAPNPAIIIGDAPWNAGAEIYSGVLRGFQFYDVVLTPAEIQQEIANPGSVRQPWYLNLNPTPTDISDKSGNGHNPAWVGPNRPALWTKP